MCGLTGFLGATKNPVNALKDMVSSISHRGPDSIGYWHDEKSSVAIGHVRLSIVDLSSAGQQPMRSHSGRYVIAFNGEIYNHLTLRNELDLICLTSWRGNSDTETLLVGFDVWGIRATIERCIGMFAFAVWDSLEKNIILGRDRMGEKPIYYGWQGSGDDACFIFASELKSLKAHPSFASNINRDSLRLYMRYGYVPTPYSIYQNIYKLPPGNMLFVSQMVREPKLQEYWSLARTAVLGVANPILDSSEKVVDDLENLLSDAVSQQMVADVPLGAFLSGGVDSSTIVSLMQVQSRRPIKTFTIGFNEENVNEALHARSIAKFLGTDHTELFVTPKQALDVIQKLPHLYCEPFADSSQIPTFLVSQLARQRVAVSLSGDAGDELFSGYNRYILTQKLWNRISRIPRLLRAFISSGIQSLSPEDWNQIINIFQSLMPQPMHNHNLGEKLHKGAGVLNSRTIDDLYLGLTTLWESEQIVIGGLEPLSTSSDDHADFPGLDGVQRMMVKDALTYLPDDILTKVDRAAMAVSLEVRVPFLDHRIVEFAWRIPQSMKLHDGVGKWVLRQVLYRHIPKELIERPKMGFSIPVDNWLRGPLREWAESLLDESRLTREGYFRPSMVRQKWAEHLSGRRNWQNHLWAVLMFQAWLEEEGS